MSMCKGKRRYSNRVTAELELQRLQENYGHVRDTPKRVYRCPTCKGWHMTRWGKA